MSVFWLYLRLFIMMFLQFAIWGAWAPVLGQVLDKMGFSGTQMGWVFSLFPLACILSPFIGGQIADRYMPTQWFLSIASIISGVAYLMASHQSGFTEMSWLMFIGCFAFAPTIALSSSLAFQNLKQVDRDFGIIRVGGTIGWIASGLILTAWRNMRGGDVVGTLPIDCLQLGGWAAILMGVYCLTLPNTPPQREGTNPLAFMQALRMLKDPVFAIFMAISFVVTTELQFYYVLTSPFLSHIGVSDASIPMAMTLAQFAEIFVMALALPLVLPRLGIRKTLAIGVIAWPIRYVIFAIGGPVWLVIASLTLHGFCYVFFFTVSQVYVDKVAPKDIRASAQSMLSLITLGIGSWLGSLFCGWIKDWQTTGTGAAAVTNWRIVFLVPILLTAACALAFMLFFKEREAAEPEVATA